MEGAFPFYNEIAMAQEAERRVTRGGRFLLIIGIAYATASLKLKTLVPDHRAINRVS